MAFQLPDLPYAHDALEPYIDKRTMEIHHGKHHAGYTSKLNAAIEGTDAAGKDIVDILKNIDSYSTAIRNNGGGYYNHDLFWKVMAPNAGGNPSGDLADAINSSFDSFEKFKEEFQNSANTRFGSGWAWLCLQTDGSLKVCSTPNQDNPLMPGVGCGGQPILGVDVWEHAYYLHYQNRRPDYTKNFFNVVNWEQVARNFAAAK
ncbi:MAG: superoxide dismutase [Chitinophagales bacterium]|nr:superoxide dismutase [Chitinophagales bacterium]